MSIPKCEECEFHILEAIYNKPYHWCMKVKIRGLWQFVFAREAKSSPKWCPKRNL